MSASSDDDEVILVSSQAAGPAEDSCVIVCSQDDDAQPSPAAAADATAELGRITAAGEAIAQQLTVAKAKVAGLTELRLWETRDCCVVYRGEA